MKKLLLVTVAVTVCLLMISGCGPRPSSEESNGNTESQAEDMISVLECYRNLSAFKGLELYVWKTGGDTYRCGLMSGTNRSKEAHEIAALPPATADEMRAILASYDIPDENIFVIPVNDPHNLYNWELDDAEIQKLREMFGTDNVLDEMQVFETDYKGYYDSISADIDNDGTEEACVLGYGRTSGLFTFTFTAKVDGNLKYENVFNSVFYYLSFAERDGKIYVQGITQGENPETHFFSISVDGGNIVLSENGKNLNSFGSPEASN